MKLWVDDIRDPKKFIPDEKNIIWAKTYKQAIKIIDSIDLQWISLDNDLGSKKTGYDVLIYLEEKTIKEENYILPFIYIHSSNVVAVKRMEDCVEGIKRRGLGKGGYKVIKFDKKSQKWYNK